MLAQFNLMRFGKGDKLGLKKPGYGVGHIMIVGNCYD